MMSDTALADRIIAQGAAPLCGPLRHWALSSPQARLNERWPGCSRQPTNGVCGQSWRLRPLGWQRRYWAPASASGMIGRRCGLARTESERGGAVSDGETTAPTWTVGAMLCWEYLLAKTRDMLSTKGLRWRLPSPYNNMSHLPVSRCILSRRWVKWSR